MTMIQNMLASVAVIVIATFLENVSASNSNSERSVINMNSKCLIRLVHRSRSRPVVVLLLVKKC
jgi:hypothetical protein